MCIDMEKRTSTSQISYRETLMGDVRKRYNEKISKIHVDPYVLGVDEFSADRLKWPKISYVYELHFLVFQESAYTNEQLKNYKSLDAYKLFQDGWVRQILHKEMDGIHLLRAKVAHSMRIREKPLEPWMIVSGDGITDSAHCTCMAGLGECCNHAAALLFALETSTRIKTDATVTDAPAYWMLPSNAVTVAPACWMLPSNAVTDAPAYWMLPGNAVTDAPAYWMLPSNSVTDAPAYWMLPSNAVTDAPAYWMLPSNADFNTPYKRLGEMHLESSVKKSKLFQSEKDCVVQDSYGKKYNNISSSTKHEETLFFDELNGMLQYYLWQRDFPTILKLNHYQFNSQWI